MKATDGCLRDVRTGTGRPFQEMLKIKKKSNTVFPYIVSSLEFMYCDLWISKFKKEYLVSAETMYSFLNLEIQRSQYINSREETIQGRKLYEEIRYLIFFF